MDDESSVVAGDGCGCRNNGDEFLEDRYDAISVTTHDYDDLEKVEYMFSEDFSPTPSSPA